MEKFMNPGERKRIDLSEMIMSKIASASAEEKAGTHEKVPELNPKVIDVYTK
jgi:hypothetical protein